MAENQIFYAKGDAPEMIQAYQRARDTFKYFWREMSWEFRRIIPALDIACVKVAFMQETEDPNDPIVEHMWINDISFDGETIRGILINDPNDITNVENGDEVEIPLHQISDWLLASEGKTYGGFTIHAMRAAMNPKERQEHDEAWGLNFGDYNNIYVVRDQDKHPENLIEHPMSINMKDSFTDFLKQYPEEVSNKDEQGFTTLHRETIAGNKTTVEILLQHHTDTGIKTPGGKTALDLAREIGWEHLIPLLSK